VSALFAGAGMKDLMSAGSNPVDTPAMRTAMVTKAAQLAPPTIAGGGTADPLPMSYYRRQADEDTSSVARKWQMLQKRNLAQKPTANELVQEAFRDVRNPASPF
jgi:hypothetical protein